MKDPHRTPRTTMDAVTLSAVADLGVVALRIGPVSAGSTELESTL
jgi:hypothetical protein